MVALGVTLDWWSFLWIFSINPRDWLGRKSPSVVTVSKILLSVGFGRFCKKNSVFGSVSVLIINAL